MLVVEDEPLVSLDVVDALAAMGAHVVSASSAGEALRSLDSFQITAAVLDINLGGHDCATVCQSLWEREIPFAFHTGYSSPLDGWANVPLIRKPAVPQEMVEAVVRLCEPRHARAASAIAP